MSRNTIRVAVVATAVAASQVFMVQGAQAHPFGMCHPAGKSGVVVYFPPGAAADAHHRLLNRDVHPEDYTASAADAADFANTGNRKCEDSRVNPTG